MKETHAGEEQAIRYVWICMGMGCVYQRVSYIYVYMWYMSVCVHEYMWYVYKYISIIYESVWKMCVYE